MKNATTFHRRAEAFGRIDSDLSSHGAFFSELRPLRIEIITYSEAADLCARRSMPKTNLVTCKEIEGWLVL